MARGDANEDVGVSPKAVACSARGTVHRRFSAPAMLVTMGWTPRLVALDIDGTVSDHDGSIPAELHAAVRRVLDAGVPVVLATGRSWYATEPVVAELDLPPGLVVCSNGSLVAERDPFEVVLKELFDPAPVIRRALKIAPHLRIAVEDLGVGFRLNRLFPDGDLEGHTKVVTVEELCTGLAMRIVIRDPNAKASDFLGLAEQLGMHGVQYYVGYSAWLDIVPDGVNKATGLERVCTDLGLTSADVLALGDGRNDIEMLQWAGRGVAIGDAPAEVRAAADHVTGTFAEFGTVTELDRWF